MALSQAISRDFKGASATLDPLLRRSDAAALRTNAFVLALAGDREGARRTIERAMPGNGAQFEPFFRMLPVLRPAEKAAAVHLGEFPKDAAQRYAQAEPVAPSPVVSISNAPSRRDGKMAKPGFREFKAETAGKGCPGRNQARAESRKACAGKAPRRPRSAAAERLRCGSSRIDRSAALCDPQSERGNAAAQAWVKLYASCPHPRPIRLHRSAIPPNHWLRFFDRLAAQWRWRTAGGDERHGRNRRSATPRADAEAGNRNAARTQAENRTGVTQYSAPRCSK